MPRFNVRLTYEISKLITFQSKVFLTVVESGSFTKAEEKLGLTQSGVSHNNAKLVSELGVVLLRRNQNAFIN
ncbi:LysR family transcriptional regulator [Bacillus pumilus]